MSGLPAWLLTAGDPGYPAPLTELDEPQPPPLYGIGDRALPDRLGDEPAVTIVGSRRASSYGLAAAADLARELAQAGVIVVSGMALGIDGAAHRGALAGGGATIAVLAGGPDLPYPPSNRHLYERIVAGGAVVSEHPPGAVARKRDFPARNRIMAALARVVVIVEAAQPSGSMITADVAAKLGRSVGAFPGQVGMRSAAGSNDLIADGAHLIRGASDVLDLLFGVGGRGVERTGPPLDQALAQALDLVEAGAVTVDGLAVAGELAPRDAALAMARLELLGYLAADPVGGFNRTALRRGQLI